MKIINNGIGWEIKYSVVSIDFTFDNEIWFEL